MCAPHHLEVLRVQLGELGELLVGDLLWSHHRGPAHARSARLVRTRVALCPEGIRRGSPWRLELAHRDAALS